MSNKLTEMAKELLTIESDLSYRLNYDLEQSSDINDFEIHVFQQVWSNTALGFNCVGGDMLTLANTYVFVSLSNATCYVYFGDRFAYTIQNYNEEFLEDLIHQDIAPVSKMSKYLNKEEDE